MKKSVLPRILITLLGIALILMGLTRTILGLSGESTNAVITHIRREGGERNESRAGRYTYNISYTFNLPDGRKIDGMSKQIGDAIFVKADRNSTVAVRYFPSLPFINTLERDAKFGLGQLVLIITGGFLIYFINAGTNRERKHRTNNYSQS